MNLYQGREYFLLRIGATEIPIDEPVNWDSALFKGARDKEFYGFIAEFVDGDKQLLFAYKDGGGNELNELYESEGPDGLVEFEFGIATTATREKQMSGRINLNTRIERSDGVECTVERISFSDLFRTRYNAKVSLNTNVSLDGEAIPAVALLNLRLHSKSITKLALAKSEEPRTHEQAFGGGAPNVPAHYIQPDTTSMEKDELDKVESMPFGITDTDPFTDQRYQYLVSEGGRLTIRFSWYVNGLVRNNGSVFTTDIDYIFYSVANTDRHRWDMFVWIERAGVIDSEYWKPATNGGPQYSMLEQTFILDVLPGDKVYVGIKVTHPVNVSSWYCDSYVNTISFEQETVAEASNCVAYRVFDFLNHLLTSVTGKANRVQSDYYGTGGPAEKRAITSGYAIRKFDVASDKPVQCDLDTALSGLAAIDNIGVGFMNIPDAITGEDTEYLVVEPMSFFYRRGVITVIREAYDWSERHDTGKSYNVVQIGFQKYPDKEFNTLDEYNTEQEWLLPVTSYKNTLSRKSSLVASGYLLEIQRREQFKKNPNTSLTNDDSLFIVCYVDETQYQDVGFTIDEANSMIVFSRPVGLDADDNIELVANGQILHIVSRNYTYPYAYNITSGASATGTDTVRVLPRTNPDGSVSNAIAERNQYFDIVENVIDPTSTYNLRITPHRNLYNFTSLLNMRMEQKDGGLYIRNTFSKNNGDLKSRIMNGAPYHVGGETREIVERANILLSDFDRDTQLFTGRQMTFKARIGYEVAKEIKQALRGELTEDKNYGCIVAPDRTGTLWLCQIDSMTYNYVNEEAQFVANKVELY